MPSEQAIATSEYRMEFLSDSYLVPAVAGDPEFTDSGVKLQYYSTKALAYYYGRCIHLLLSGMANGKSITTELRNIPSEPMGTVYLQAGGTVGRFRANGTTFAFDSEALVVGCDAMLDGGAGKLTGASGVDWFPMMVGASNLPTVTPTTNNSPALANTITAPSGFDPMAPGNIWASFGTAGVEGDVYAVELTRASVVQAKADTVRRESVSRSLSWALVLPYSLATVVETGTSVAVSFGTILASVDLYVGSGSGVIANLGSSINLSELYAGSGSGVIANLGASTSTSALNALFAGSGSGVIANLSPGVAMATRSTRSYTTDSLAQFGSADFVMNLGTLAELVAVQLSEASWVRMYRTNNQRAADSRNAPGGNLQAIIDLGENKPLSENVTTQANQTIVQNPVPLMQGDETGLIYVRLIKQSGGTGPVTLTITIFLEEI